jgi:ApaG protein
MKAPRMADVKHRPLHACTSEAVTRDVRVEVESKFAPEYSEPFRQVWRFIYTIKITNEGSERVKLLGRHWFITDATGHVEEVEGDSVVGENPSLGPGESFQYTSWCELTTSSGIMKGSYRMASRSGEHFDVEIAPFALQEPYTVH